MLYITLFCLFVGGICDDPDQYLDETAAVRFEAKGFEEVVKLLFFVDKTMLIHEFLQPSGFAFYVIAPLGFGCSINMDMIKRFCERVVHVNGNIVPKQETTNYKLFTSKTSNGYLNIFKEKEFFNEHFGEYPVISLDFRSFSNESFDNFIIKFKRLISFEFKKHRYLTNSALLSDKDKSDFNIYSEEESMLNVGAMLLEQSLVLLSRLLHLHFGKKCIVLIDEYDSTVYKTILYSGRDIIPIMEFMNCFITNILKAKEFVYKALIHSRLRLSTVLSGLGNSSVEFVSFMKKNRFTNYYGMTDTELAHLTRSTNVHDQLRYLQLWYGGYRVFGTNDTINHVYSIANYLTYWKYVIYWPEEELTRQLVKVCRVNDKALQIVMRAVLHNTSEVVAYDHLNGEQVVALIDMVGESKNLTETEDLTNTYITFLVFSGYLRLAHGEHAGQYIASFPNKQMKLEVFTKLAHLATARIKPESNMTNEIGPNRS